MRVIVDEDVVVAAATAQGVTKLHRLLGFAAEGRHVVVANPVNGFANWLSGLDQPTREAYQLALELSARSATTLDANAATVHVRLQQADIWAIPTSTLSLDKAVCLLDSPLVLIVENAANDWHFLRRMMRPSECQKIEDAISRRWVEVMHGGGADIKERLKERAKRRESCLRTFAMFDSDRRHPDELDPSWAPTASEACEGFHIEAAAKATVEDRYWRLNRRSIESYLPRAELEAKAASAQGVSSDAVEAFFRMPPEGQWFFNMKKGLKGDQHVENAHRAKSLYSGLNPSDKAALNMGFGRNVADQFNESSSVNFNWDTEALREAAISIPRIMRLI